MLQLVIDGELLVELGVSLIAFLIFLIRPARYLQNLFGVLQ